MKKAFIWSITTLLTISVSYGQSILKKKEVKERLDQISTDIQNKDFEKAMTLFDSKQEIISEENVPKKLFDKYKTIKTTVEQKKKEFDTNREKVNAYQKQYNSKDYCFAVDLLDLSLTKENSYQETQDIQTKLTSSLKQAKQKCEDNSIKLIQWKKDYQNQEYEKLHKLKDISQSDKNYYYESDLKQLESMQTAIYSKYIIYKAVKDKIVISPNNIINKINLNNLTYNQAIQYIDKLSNTIKTADTELQKLEGKNHQLIAQYSKLKPKIQRTLSELKEFSIKNKPPDFSKIDYSICKKNYFPEISFKEGMVMDIFCQKFYESVHKKFNTSITINTQNLMIEAKEYEWEFGKMATKPLTIYYRIYDNKDQLVEERWMDCIMDNDYYSWYYNFHTSLHRPVPVSYVFNNNTVSIIPLKRDWIGPETYIENEYDSNGEFVREKIFVSSGYESVERRLIRSKTIDHTATDDNVVELDDYQYHFIYNSAGLIEKVYSIDRDAGKKIDHIKCEWHSNKIISYFIGFFSTCKKMFTFDSKGRLLTEQLSYHQLFLKDQYKLERQVTYSYNGDFLKEINEKVYNLKVNKLISTKTIKFTYSYD